MSTQVPREILQAHALEHQALRRAGMAGFGSPGATAVGSPGATAVGHIAGCGCNVCGPTYGQLGRLGAMDDHSKKVLWGIGLFTGAAALAVGIIVVGKL